MAVFARNRRGAPVTKAGTARAVGGVLALGAGIFFYASVIERRAFRLRRASFPVLEADSKPITVLHLSDLHLAPWQRDKQRWVQKLARFEPDLIVTTGDNLGHREALPFLRKTLEPFRGVPGVFVWGNNDYFEPVPKNPLRYLMGPSKPQQKLRELPIDDMRAFFSDLGWVDLNNDAARVRVAGRELELFGVDDPHHHLDDLGRMQRRLDELDTREEVPVADASPAPLRIGVVHAPYRRILDALLAENAAVIFAGHTHGGQLRIPGYGAVVTNCDIPRGQVRGASRWGSGNRRAYLNVSAGLGTSIFAPIRFACPPEASLITLIAAD